MPYPSILKDLNAKAIPQVYDGNNFQPDTGKRILYGPNGVTPLSVVDSKLGIRATELEAKLQSMLDDGVPQSGSIVEEYTQSITIASGASVSSQKITVDCKKIGIGILETNTNNFSVTASVWWYLAGNTLGSTGATVLLNAIGTNNARALSAQFDIKSPSFKFRITNNDSSSHTMDVYIEKGR